MQKSGEARDINLSKALSWLLRHGAVKEKLQISDDGYLSVNDVLRHKSIARYSLSDILRVVERNDKQRFSLRSNPTTNELEIKANQGHSIKVPDLELQPFECSDQSVLFHATYSKNWEKIKQTGLSRMNRNHIHLNPDIPGYSRRGCDVFIYVNARKLLEDGIPLYVAPNHVILCPGNQEGIIHPKYFEEVKFKKSSVSQSKHKEELIIYFKKMFCEVCKMHLESKETWGEHIVGERHQSSLKALSEGTGIFIRGIDERFKYQHLKSFFSRFGKIEEIFMNKKRMFAIIEFSKRESAELALSREIILCGKRLRIFPRKVNRIADSTNSGTASTSTASKEEDKEESYRSLTYISVDAFDVELDNFVREVEAKDIESKVNMLCHSLKFPLSCYFPGCQIHPFGSSVTGLAAKDSDVDIFVDLCDKVSVEAAGNLVNRAKYMLKKFNEFSKIIPIPRARVPIIKCHHKSTNLQCDINFTNPHGVHNSNLIKFFISLEPRLRTILMVLKHWAKIHELNGQGHLTSYALVMLLFFYLQQLPNPILPTVQKLQSLCKSVVLVEDWECHFKCNIEDLDQDVHIDSSLQILLDFFLFYSSFAFEENVIILQNALAIPRKLIVESPENSPWFKYKIILEKVNAQPVNLDKPMCVLDPFVLNHNITAVMGLRDINRFQIYCYKAAEIFSKIKRGEETSCLKALFAINPKNQIKYPFVLETWDGNGNVNLIIPVSSFNPKNTFEDSRLEPDTPDQLGKLMLMMEHVTKIFEKVLRFVLVRTDSYQEGTTPDRQVLKKEESSDVHSNAGGNKMEQCVYFYSSFFQVWNGRNNAYRQFSFPKSMSYMEKEKHVTDYIVDKCYKGSMEGLKQTDIKCNFSPYMENRCLQLQLILSGGCKSMKPMTTFLLTILHKWLDK